MSIRQRPGHTGTRLKETCIENRKKDRTFAARKLMGQYHHRVFMYTSDLSVSKQKKSRQRRLPICGDSSQVRNYEQSILHRGKSNGKVKNRNRSWYGVADDPPLIQAGWSDSFCVTLFFQRLPQERTKLIG
jgi:hypothetical protein